MNDPVIIKDMLDEKDYLDLLIAVRDIKQFEFQAGFGRYIVADRDIPKLKELADKLTPKARKVFGSDTLVPSYTLFSHYEGQDPVPSLYKHKDDNACTYTLDMCVYQKEPWDLWVEDKAYTLHKNEALAYYGNDQWHWREAFPNPETNEVAMIFFHFVEPDHWYITKGPGYLEVIRGNITEEEWLERNEK